MSGTRVGEIDIARLLDWEGPFFEAGRMFPDATPDALAPHRHWLEPWALTPDESRLVLPVQSYLLQTRHHKILVDTCIGNHKSANFFAPWHNREDPGWLHQLALAGVAPSEIDYVLCTHLHSDHSGWNTTLVNGRWQPTFPNARYVIARTEFEYAESRGGESFEENLVPIMEAGLGTLVETDWMLDDQVRLQPTPGHTPGHVCIQLESLGHSAVLCGDIMHSPVQCAEPQWHAVSDNDPEVARLTRRTLLEQHADRDVRILTAHFPTPSIGRFVTINDAFRFVFD